MIPDVPREELLAAIDKFDKELRSTEEWSSWEQKGPHKYAISHDGQRYPVKQIIRMATGEKDFSGGQEANSYVRKRGLRVTNLRDGSDEGDGMGIREGLETILSNYTSARAEDFAGHELWSTFKETKRAIEAAKAIKERNTLRVKPSRGQGNWVSIPWIAVFDARETTTIQRGVYSVYLFREDMTGVYLALAQGITEYGDNKELYGGTRRDIENHLVARARALRRFCGDLIQHGFALDNGIDLHSDTTLGSGYEASTVAYKFYDADSVPDDSALADDLEDILTAYNRYLNSEDSQSRLWCIYVGRQAAENFDLGRSEGTWGANAENKFKEVHAGDSLLFVHSLASDMSPTRRGFPRVKLPEELRGTAALLVRAKVTSDVFEDSSPLWPDDVYPYRFHFQEEDEDHDIEFNTETFPTEVVEAVRLSASTQGRPVLVEEIAGKVPAKQGGLEELVKHTNLTRSQLEEIESLLREKKQIIFEGPPGAGKTYIAELFARYFTRNPLKGSHDERLAIVQFHQSYGYEDFVQGIRPQTNAKGQLEYRVQDGIFKYLCDVARRNPDEDFVILIDEINRGNISRIFGELLFLLEYRDEEVSLPYSRPGDPMFSIPERVYLLGTMNTTDRSLAQIDYALRRRFYFYRMLPVVDGEAPVLKRWLEKQDLSQENRDQILRLFINLNNRIQSHLGEHFQVGHSYFMTQDIGTDDGRRRVWAHAIEPLVEEYFYSWRDKEVLSEFELERLLSDQDSQE